MSELHQLLKKIVSPVQGGFLTGDDVKALASGDRLRQVLVRCGACRFIISADSFEHMAGIIDREGTDYIRDISLPSSDGAYRGDYKPVTPERPTMARAAIQQASKRAAKAYLDNLELEVDAMGNCYSDADPGL
jgi:hypothetical protein